MNEQVKPAFPQVVRVEDVGWAIKTHIAYVTTSGEVVGRGHQFARKDDAKAKLVD